MKKQKNREETLGEEQEREAVLGMPEGAEERLNLGELERAIEVLRRGLPPPWKRMRAMDARTMRVHARIESLVHTLKSKRAKLDKRYSAERDGTPQEPSSGTPTR